MTISLLVVGKTGTGKSTIGNMILTGRHDGVFVTDERTPDDAFTVDDAAITCSGKCGDLAVSFTDTPGIPDSYPERTKDCYDTVINAIKRKPLSAILFVFEYGRIDYSLYQKSEVLFREINKANCMKVLIINDHADRSNKPIPGEHYAKLAETISQYTKINFYFDDDCWVDCNTMPDKMQSLMKSLQQIAKPPVLSSGLQTFTEVATYANALKSESKHRADVKAQILADINDRRQKQKIILAGGVAAVGVSGAGAAVVIITVGTIIFPLLVVAAGIAPVVGAHFAWSQNHKEINKLKRQEVETTHALEDAEIALATFNTNFNSLCLALGVTLESIIGPNSIV